VPRERGGRRWQRWRLGVRLLRRGAGRWTIPEDYLRSRPWPLLQIRAPGGPGRGTRAGRRRRRSAGTRWEPAWAVRTRPRSGAGSGGGGKRTPCVCECKGSDTSRQLHFPSGKTSGDLGKPFISSLRRMQVGSLVVALPRLCIWPPGHFVVTGLSRRRARCITLFAASLSILGATPAHLCRRVSKSRPGVSDSEYPGKLWKIKNLWHQRGPANYRGETQAGSNSGPQRQ
jgi:hypothetical protein